MTKTLFLPSRERTSFTTELSSEQETVYISPEIECLLPKDCNASLPIWIPEDREERSSGEPQPEQPHAPRCILRDRSRPRLTPSCLAQACLRLHAAGVADVPGEAARGGGGGERGGEAPSPGRDPAVLLWTEQRSVRG